MEPNPIAPAGDERFRNFTAARLCCWVAVFGVLQLAMRSATGPGLTYDDAEQAMLAHQWSWGYGPQPPLYTWLVRGASSIIGDMRMTLFLVRQGLLMACFLLSALLARRLVGGPKALAAGGLAPLLTPIVAIECQFDYTHTIAALAASLLTCWALVGVVQHRRTSDYAVLGIALALGALSKFSFLLLPPALLIGTLSMPRGRLAVLDPRMLACLLLVALAVWPAAEWMLSHPDVMGAKTYRLSADGPWSLASTMHGVKHVLEGLALVVAPMVVVQWLIRGRRHGPARQKQADGQEGVALVCRSVLIGVGLVLAMVVLLGVRNVRSPWLLPLCFPLTVACAAHWARTADAARMRRLVIAGAISAGVSLAWAPMRVLLLGQFTQAPIEALDFPAVVGAMRSTHRIDGATVIATEAFLAGNVCVLIPGGRAVTPVYAHFQDASAGPLVLVWFQIEPTPAIPGWIRRFFSSRYGRPVPDLPIQTVEVPIRDARGGYRTLGFVVIPR